MTPSRIRSEVFLVTSALFIAFVLWLIAKQAELEIDRLMVPVTLVNVPEFMEVKMEPPRVTISVQYPSDVRNSVVERNFSLEIDPRELFDEDPTKWVTPTVAMARDYVLDENMVEKNTARSVRVTAVEPESLKLHASLRWREVRVEVRTQGELPDTHQLTQPLKADPDKLLVTGSRDALNALAEADDTLWTESIDLSGLKTSKVLFLKVEIPENLFLLERPDASIEVDVGLTEVTLTQEIEDVPIELIRFQEVEVQVIPQTAKVKVEGPISLLEQIGPGDFEFETQGSLDERPGEVQDIGVEAKFKSRVPQEVADGVQIIECNPPRITVEFKETAAENEPLGEAEEDSAP